MRISGRSFGLVRVFMKFKTSFNGMTTDFTMVPKIRRSSRIEIGFVFVMRFWKKTIIIRFASVGSKGVTLRNLSGLEINKI